jgi:hypothetical protein
MAIPGDGSAMASASDAGSDESGQKSGAEKRISQLVAERNTFRDQWSESQNRLSALEQRMSSGPSQPEPDPLAAASFADLDDGVLKSQYAEAVTNQDGATAAELMAEMARRVGQHSGKRTAEQLRQEHAQSNHAQTIQSEMQTRFADVVGDRSSPVYQKADQIAGYFTKVHGPNALQERPELGLLSFALASLDVNGTATADEMQRLKDENARLRSAADLGDGLTAASRMNDDAREALKAGDIKRTFRNLGIVKSLE